MKLSTHSLTRAAVIGALYVLLTFVFQAISFGPVQFRISEALMMLPVFTFDAIPGLFVGCLISNLLNPGGAVWFDVLFGSIATLLTTIFVRRLHNRTLIAAAMPAVFNGLIVGPIVYLAYVRAPGEAINWLLMFSSVFTVALGEIIVCYVLGLPLLKVLNRLPAETWEKK